MELQLNLYLTLFLLERKPRQLHRPWVQSSTGTQWWIREQRPSAVSVCVELAKPTDHDSLAHKTRSASAIFATSYSRGMTSSSQSSDPNLKSNAKLEESLTNHDREAYGRNILARQPSVDTPHKLTGTNSRTRLHPPVLHVAYDRRLDVVNLSDVPRSCSQC